MYIGQAIGAVEGMSVVTHSGCCMRGATSTVEGQ